MNRFAQISVGELMSAGWFRLAAVCALVVSGHLVLSSDGRTAPVSEFPNRPINIVVGFTPGGGNDVVARIVGNKVGELLGTQVVVLNRPGANGAIATESVAKAAPDGYTIILGSSSVIAINPLTTSGSTQDSIRGFVGLGTVAMTPQVLAVHPSVKAENLADLAALGRSEEVSLASAGLGGLPHFAIELLQLVEKIKFVHVPYRGGAPAATDVVAGHVNGIIMDLPVVQPFIADGKMRAIAVLNSERSAALPGVPTSVEQGASDLVALNWYALLAPPGTPDTIADKLHKAFATAVHDPAIKAKLAEIGIEPMTSKSRAEFRSFLEGEIARWLVVARAAGLTPN